MSLRARRNALNTVIQCFVPMVYSNLTTLVLPNVKNAVRQFKFTTVASRGLFRRSNTVQLSAYS